MLFDRQHLLTRSLQVLPNLGPWGKDIPLDRQHRGLGRRHAIELDRRVLQLYRIWCCGHCKHEGYAGFRRQTCDQAPD